MTNLRVLFVVVGVVVAPALEACHPSSITSNRLENAVAKTFANLIHVQTKMLGAPPIEAESLHATASCQRNGSAAMIDQPGPGNWRCTITWFVPTHAAPVHDTYDVSVTADACYTATADGAEAHIGGPTLKTPQGVSVTNLLFAFDGCFDSSR